MKELGKEPLIHEATVIENSHLGEYVEIGPFNTLENTSMGDYSYSGPFCIFQNTTIGRFSNIAAQVRIGPTNHPMDRPTQHHFTYRRTLYGFDTVNDDSFFQWRKEQRVHIGHDTWIGHGAVILSGVRIGTGAVVGAGSIVTKNIPDYAVAVGNPARVIRSRFTHSQQNDLKEIAWWQWSHDQLKRALEDFTGTIDNFISKYKG